MIQPSRAALKVNSRTVVGTNHDTQADRVDLAAGLGSAGPRDFDVRALLLPRIVYHNTLRAKTRRRFAHAVVKAAPGIA